MGTHEPDRPGAEQTPLRWEASGRRQDSITQRGGMAPAPQCSHKHWRTYEGHTKWWQRCESCKGRLAEGEIQEQDGQKRLAGWTPPGWGGKRTPTRIINLGAGSWQCGLCQQELPFGVRKVLTDVGQICYQCRSGTYVTRTLSGTESATSSTSPEEDTGGMHLNPRQVKFLEELLTARQWKQLLELQDIVGQ